MVIFPLAADQTIAQMWSNGALPVISLVTYWLILSQWHNFTLKFIFRENSRKIGYYCILKPPALSVSISYLFSIQSRYSVNCSFPSTKWSETCTTTLILLTSVSLGPFGVVAVICTFTENSQLHGRCTWKIFTENSELPSLLSVNFHGK